MRTGLLLTLLCLALLLCACGQVTTPAAPTPRPAATPAPTPRPAATPAPTPLPTDAPVTKAERLGFDGANVAIGGMMVGDGTWVYYRSEEDWGLYKARTDGTGKACLLPVERFSPACLNLLDGWLYFSNFRDGFSLWRARTDGSDPERLAEGWCDSILVTERGIYFSWRDENNADRAFRMNLDGTAPEMLMPGVCPESYWDGTLYLYSVRSGVLTAYDVADGSTRELARDLEQAAYFSVDDSGVYFWENTWDYCRLDPDTGEITVVHPGPIGDYFNYVNGTIYYIGYGGEDYNYFCCYALDPVTGEETPILSLSDQFFGYDGELLGITWVQFRNGDFDPERIPRDGQGMPMMLDEMAWAPQLVNGQVFVRGRLLETRGASSWIVCDGAGGQAWGSGGGQDVS